eukprot:jgi/Mesen1/6442/ME000033S05731
MTTLSNNLSCQLQRLLQAAPSSGAHTLRTNFLRCDDCRPSRLFLGRTQTGTKDRQICTTVMRGGGGGFNQFQTPNPPQQQKASPPQPGKTVLPGANLRAPPGSQQSVSPPGLGQFKPPRLPIPGMSMEPEGEAPEQSATGGVTVDEQIERVKDSFGSWQERAATLKALHKTMTAEALYERTYIPTQRQTEVIVAAQVYESLVDEDVDEDLLESFADESEIEILYELRVLSGRQRAVAARELAKAMKDHERRPNGREVSARLRQGFTTAPGDCLAFSLHRSAVETRDPEARAKLAARGLAAATSKSAQARFAELT